MKQSVLFRILASILTLCLLAAPFVGVIPSAFAEPAGDLWTQIEAMRDGVFKRGGKAPSVEAFAAISDDIYALVEQSGEAIPGTLQAKGDFISWRDIDGIPCCYSPAHEAEMATRGVVSTENVEVKATPNLLSVSENSGSSAVNIGLIQPYYQDSTHYYDSTFTTYSPAYVTQANALAEATGGKVIRYTLENATLNTIASTLEECGMVIIDSHGGTDYANGEDCTSRANCSYIWLTSGYSTSTEFKRHWSEFLYREEYYASHEGPYGTYEDVYLSSDGSYCVNGRLIANHMEKDAPHSLLYMSSCLGMATDGLEAPLRAKGVEAVYGYSQSVTFAGDRNYMTVITDGLISGQTLGEAVASAKTTVGYWDNSGFYTTIDKARANYCSFPIVASSEDTYPGHGNVDALQIVKSTWTLLPRCTVTAVANDSGLGTISVSGASVTASPKDGYYVQSAEIISGTGTCTANGNTIEVDAQTDCTVLITFAILPQVTLSFAGVDAAPVTGTAESTVQLPLTAVPQAGMEFIGWTESSLEQGSPELPVYFAPGSSYTLPYEDTTLYALYTYFDETAVAPITPRYVRVRMEDDFAAIVGSGHSFLIAADLSTYAMVFNSSLSTPYASKNYETVSYLNGEKGILPSNSTTNACAVRLAPVSGTSNYSIRLRNGSGPYVKCNQATGITTSSAAYPLSVEISAADLHYIRDSAVRNYRFLMHDYGDGSYSFGFTNGASFKTVLYRYEDEIVGLQFYLTAKESCPHTATVLTDAVAPTCTSVGYTGNTVCADCGFVLSESTRIPALGHDIIKHEGKAATCTEKGWTAYETCSRCDYTTYEELMMLYHDVVRYEAKAPTCTEVGWNAYQACSRCGYSTYQEIPALGHDITKHEAKAPTCTEAGWNAYESCSRCSYTTYQETPALGHVITEHPAKAPTCTRFGWDAYETCSRCGYSSYHELPALGHDITKHEAKAPTCTEIGWTAYETCSRCDYTTYEELMRLYHDVVRHEAKAPTCTEPGWNTYLTCSRCDYSTYREISALGHNLVKHAAKAPTCTEPGWTAYETCSHCGYTTYQEIPALGHDMTAHEGKAPTCTEKGWTAYETCSRCGYTTYQEIAALGHSIIEQEGKAPTCTEEGWSDYQTCACCDYTTYQALPALGHDAVAHEAKAATCTEKGWNAYETCSRCDYSTYEEIAPLGHDFSNGKCVCGAEMEIQSAALHLNENINMAYAVKLPEGAEEPYMVFSCNGTEHTVDSFTVNESGDCCFEFLDINPQCMGDNITATFHATVDGVEYTDTVGNYSVRDYCVNQLEKTKDPEMKTLLSDILVYGAAAQTYTGYETDELITDGLDLTPSNFESFSGKAVTFTGEQSDDARWISASLVLSNDVAARFGFVADRIDGLCVEVTINGRTQIFDTFESAGNGRYYITFEGIMATEFDDVVTARFVYNGKAFGAAVHYSVNTYICGMQNSTNGTLADLVQALYNYGASTAAYAD